MPAAQRIRANDGAIAAAVDDLVTRAIRQRPRIEIVVLAEPQILLVAKPMASRKARRITGFRKPISPREAPRLEMLPSMKPSRSRKRGAACEIRDDRLD